MAFAASTPTSARRRLRGVTLIEVLIAGSLLAIGVTGIISCWRTTASIIEHQRRFTDATNLARSGLEKLLLLPAGDPALATSYPTEVLIAETDAFGAPSSGPLAYRTVYTVRTIPMPASFSAAGIEEDFVELTVTTRWLEAGGARSTSFNSYRER